MYVVDEFISTCYLYEILREAYKTSEEPNVVDQLMYKIEIEKPIIGLESLAKTNMRKLLMGTGPIV